MADEPNTPDHRWYERRNNIALSNEDLSRETIFDSGIQKINSWINSQPWGFDYPQLVLDFDDEYFRVDGGDTTFSSAITHTRASTATYVDSTGTLQTAAINEPRLGHHVWNGTAWVNEGLLHESEARTNLLRYSEEFDNAVWNKFAAGVASAPIVTANAGVAPDGTSTADRVQCNLEGGTTTSDRSHVEQVISSTVGTTLTPSVWVKGYEGDTSTLEISVAGVNRQIITLSDQWQRINTSWQTTITSLSIRVGLMGGRTPANSDTADFLVWGAQLEAAPTPSSYIPTAGSTVTRAADVLTVPAANLPYPTPTVIGPELVTNGTFDADSDWAKGTGWTISGSVATHAAGSGSDITQASVLTAGKVYRLTLDVTAVRASSILYVLAKSPTSGNAYQEIEINLTVGAKETIFIAPSDNNLTIRLGGPADADVDNISVREINPLALSIQMDGRITFADEGVATATLINWFKDAATRLQVRLDTGATNTGNFLFLQEANDVTDFIASPFNTFSPDVLVPFNTASRHGSTFIDGAVNGTALTANTTPVALPDLSATNLTLGSTYNGTIRTFRMWGQDIGDAGLVEATS